MSSPRERRAVALEAIAHALLELAAVEREPEEEVAPQEVLVDHRNCEKELGLVPRAFTAAAGRDFPAFRVSKRQTATKADVLAWLKTRKVEPKPPRLKEAPKGAPDPDAFLKEIHARFAARVGRAMTDDELDQADTWVLAGREVSVRRGRDCTNTADEVAAHVQAKIGKEPNSHARWRSLGLDPQAMERDAEALRQKLFREHPEMGWRDRVRAVYKLWDAVTAPLEEAKRAARAAARAAKKDERAKRGELGLKR